MYGGRAGSGATPAKDIIWVVDPSHFGIHALKLSALKEGRIERHVAAGTTEFDHRLNYRCHFGTRPGQRHWKPVAFRDDGERSTQLWVANDSKRYDRCRMTGTAIT